MVAIASISLLVGALAYEHYLASILERTREMACAGVGAEGRHRAAVRD